MFLALTVNMDEDVQYCAFYGKHTVFFVFVGRDASQVRFWYVEHVCFFLDGLGEMFCDSLIIAK